MLELWQTKWCPASQRIRARLTELGVDYVTRQVPVGKEQRQALRKTTGSETIPTLVSETARSPSASKQYAVPSTNRSTEPPEADAHRLKAAKARQRYLEEECKCLQPATR
jgi:glutaredoxin